ncbi:hypothetical protein BH18ACT4_BH18ACT4_15480 [soil metagenome]
MDARWIRRLVILVCVAGIAGMIAGSIAERTGAAITAGLISAVAVLCLILVTATAGPAAFGRSPGVDEGLAADVERRVASLVTGGADEAEVRSLVRAASRLRRS